MTALQGHLINKNKGEGGYTGLPRAHLIQSIISDEQWTTR